MRVCSAALIRCLAPLLSILPLDFQAHVGAVILYSNRSKQRKNFLY